MAYQYATISQSQHSSSTDSRDEGMRGCMILSHTHFGLSTRRRESLGFFTQSRLQSPSSGLDQQSADWCTITTSVQTEANSDANFPLWAQCGESRDLASTSASGFACVCTVCLYLQILLGGFCDLSTLYALYFHGDSLRIPRGI